MHITVDWWNIRSNFNEISSCCLRNIQHIWKTTNTMLFLLLIRMNSYHFNWLSIEHLLTHLSTFNWYTQYEYWKKLNTCNVRVYSSLLICERSRVNWMASGRRHSAEASLSCFITSMLLESVIEQQERRSTTGSQQHLGNDLIKMGSTRRHSSIKISS